MEWNPSPEIFSLGPLSIRWYGLLFAVGFLFGYQYGSKIFKKEKKPMQDRDSLLLHVMLGTIIGARLGHCLFYEPGYYLSHPLEIFKVWEGGLASHGGTLGVMFAVWLYVRKHPDQPWLWIGDRLSAMIGLVAGFIRLGNFFNSEIVGKPTELPWGIVFTRIDSLARHPSQLYETACYWATAIVCHLIYKKYGAHSPRGLSLGVMLLMIFTGRFFIEFSKENQVAFEAAMTLNMGQLLSIPFTIAAAWLIWRAVKNGPVKVK